MGLFNKLKNEFIDIIDWLDPSNNTIVYRFPRYQNEIKMGAKLTVRESQVAVFINEGQIADIFQPVAVHHIALLGLAHTFLLVRIGDIRAMNVGPLVTEVSRNTRTHIRSCESRVQIERIRIEL